MDSQELELRRGIIEAGRQMNATGLNQGTSGNVSARHGGRMLITPSGIPYTDLEIEDITAMPLNGAYGAWESGQKPSSEWRFHLDITRARPEVGAIVHTHSTYATALACCRKEIPACHYMVAASGGPTIRCSRYATFGTQELSNAALEALAGRTCCLLANHGVIATGPDLKKAMWLAIEVETIAKQYVLSLAIGDGPVILPDEEIANVLERMKGYGPQQKTADPTGIRAGSAA